MLDKLARKDRRRAERAGADADLEWLLVNGFEALLEATLEAESDMRGVKLSGGVCTGWTAVGFCLTLRPIKIEESHKSHRHTESCTAIIW